MGREFELKYRISEEMLEQVYRDYGEFQKIEMQTVYYDVPGALLGKLHWTLRRRMENETSVCTLKTPCPDGGRGEWEVECPDILQAVPQLIAMGAPGELAAYTAKGVEAVCGARFTRLAKKVPVFGGAVELALDRGVLLGGGKELPFAELEVELKEGADEAAIAFAQLLAKKYVLIPEHKSKVKRARELAGL